MLRNSNPAVWCGGELPELGGIQAEAVRMSWGEAIKLMASKTLVILFDSSSFAFMEATGRVCQEARGGDQLDLLS